MPYQNIDPKKDFTQALETILNRYFDKNDFKYLINKGFIKMNY